MYCDPIQKSLDWCEGKPQYAGVRKRVYYTAKSNLIELPKVPVDENGRPISGILAGSFVMKVGKCFYGIDHLPEKAEVGSETQGEYPAQSSHDKAVLLHPGVGYEASIAASYFLNTDNVYIIEDFDGSARVIGIEPAWKTKASVSMNFGQGAAGTPGSTITIEGDNKIPFPEYRGIIETEDGEIDYSQNNVRRFSSEFSKEFY